ncbi:excinuclease ABC subunit C, partial [Patescibacteria group bacterium]|nr:excinuclease ABC subunit C [Patescibacteria group bacterium]
SMVVFEDGQPRQDCYRKFKIKTVVGPNDTAMIEEVLRRRLAHLQTQQTTIGKETKKWPRPDLILVDGGRGQINTVRRVLKEHNLDISVVGLAKGFNRKQDELVYDKSDHELARLVQAFKPLLQQVRDEAHRFAVAYHRKLRKKR